MEEVPWQGLLNTAKTDGLSETTILAYSYFVHSIKHGPSKDIRNYLTPTGSLTKSYLTYRSPNQGLSLHLAWFVLSQLCCRCDRIFIRVGLSIWVWGFFFFYTFFSEKSTWDCMQSFWAIIHFAFSLSDWFIAHSNALKGLNTLYEQVWLRSHLEYLGLWGLCYSAWDHGDAVCQLLHIPTTRIAEIGLQVPKDPYRTRGWRCLSCTVLQDEHL